MSCGAFNVFGGERDCKGRKSMESKEFEYNGKRYRIEKYADGEIRVFEHLYGDQRPLIVNKLNECMQAVQGEGFDSRSIEYVNAYIAGTNKDNSLNTRHLGKILFDHLP
jgi:hypothetical protein